MRENEFVFTLGFVLLILKFLFGVPGRGAGFTDPFVRRRRNTHMVQLARIHQIQAANDVEGAIQLRDEWVQTVNALANQISEWSCRQEGWQVIPMPDKEIDEEPLGVYIVPMFWIRTGSGTLLFEPEARDVGGGDGLVDLYDYPGMSRISLLYQESGQTWTAWTDSRMKWPRPWSETTFLELANGLMAHDLSTCSATDINS